MKPLRFAVIGDPVSHSKSPAMHSAALRALALPHTYEALRVAADGVADLVTALRRGEIDGVNVTVPHKERVVAFVDALDESARVAGAVNTLVRDDSGPAPRVVGHNTDAPALAAEIARLAGDPAAGALRDASAIVLGSGGAARAAVAALGVHLGVRDIVVRARSFGDLARRDAFVRSAAAPVQAEALDAARSAEPRALVVIQATSAGMRGAEPGDAIARAIDWEALPSGAVALDVVYAPRSTPWLEAARARGLRADDGLGMLARQGALAFELWLGRKAPLDVMRAAIE